MRTRIDVQTVLDVGDRHTRRLGVDQAGIGTPRQQGVLAHPEKVCLKLVSGFNRM